MMRQLTEILNAGEAGAIYSLLLSVHIEIYIKKDGENPTHFVENPKETEGECVYVPEADYEEASRVLCEAGYADLVCREQKAAPETEEERILRDFQKKRKWHMIEWIIVILAVLLFRFFTR
ncbi:MAG: hypothetical protein Q4B01_06600 [Eubacteriales bacterium]|nr:hypothetical protein [Eubacteriales bacterium]